MTRHHPNDLGLLLKAAAFAAGRHCNQRRKGADASPYINHPLEVANLLANVAGISDTDTLAAAILHDTIEDTATSGAEIETIFGRATRLLVEEVTDDKNLPKEVRKQLQIEHAPRLSDAAKLIKLGDKISNVRDVTENPPPNWPLARRREYLDWTEQVVAGCRGASAALERLYDETLSEARAALARDLAKAAHEAGREHR